MHLITFEVWVKGTALEKRGRGQWIRVGNTRQRRLNEKRWCFKCQISMKLILYIMPHAVILSTPYFYFILTNPFPLTLFPVHYSLTFTALFLLSLSHLFRYCFLTTCPFISLSVPPSLHLSHRSVVIWTDVSAELIIPSSCCLPTATLFPSCVSASLPLLPSASPCHSHRLSPFRHLSLYHVYCPLFGSHSFPPSLLPPSLLFPSETGLSGRFSHLSTSSLMLFCLHVHVFMRCTLCRVCICKHIYVCISAEKLGWGCLCPLDTNQLWP